MCIVEAILLFLSIIIIIETPENSALGGMRKELMP
jgi:hypothetical protein